jgi:hypothetical protein
MKEEAIEIDEDGRSSDEEYDSSESEMEKRKS